MRPFLSFAGLALAVCLSTPAISEPRSAIAMHGEPAQPAGFANFPYAAPEAPKGGQVRLGLPGSFDSLNPLIVKGEPAAGVRDYVFETLMARSLDEPFSLYSLIAESIDVAQDRSEVTFHLDPRARFSDGHPITSDDVIFSLELLREKGRPNHVAYYKKVRTAERLSERAVRFVLDAGGDREMPLILGLMPVLPAHATNRDTFDSTTLAPPIGSGPYRIAKVDPGRSITYERNPDYWGRDLPVNRGRFNFDEIRFDYYRDEQVMLEAFKRGEIDLRTEYDPGRWSEGFDTQAKDKGRIIKAEFETGLPAGMSALVLNTRRPQFRDVRVREALGYLFNFEWINKTVNHGLYARTESYFERSYLSSAGRAADDTERALLAPFPDAVRGDVMDGSYRQPVGDGSAHNRDNAQRAFDLLTEAGYVLDGSSMVEAATGRPLTFEILASSSAQERLLAAFTADCAKLGIAARIRVVDSAQYQSRLKDYDFDIIKWEWLASLSPGNEQLFRWSSAMATQPGSFNYAGVESKAADAMIQALLTAETPEAFVSAVRALDRVLRSGHYVIPLFYSPRQWVAHWSRLERPARSAMWGYTLDTWWAADGR